MQVKEEAGLDCEPISLLLIQEQGPQWIRFVFLARVTGQRSLRQKMEAGSVVACCRIITGFAGLVNSCVYSPSKRTRETPRSSRFSHENNQSV